MLCFLASTSYTVLGKAVKIAELFVWVVAKTCFFFLLCIISGCSIYNFILYCYLVLLQNWRSSSRFCGSSTRSYNSVPQLLLGVEFVVI